MNTEVEEFELLAHHENDEPVINEQAIHTHTGATKWQAAFNVMCTMIGVGLIGLPAAMAETGWIGGTMSIWLFGAMAVYCGVILSRCLNEGRHGLTIQTYPQLGFLAAGKPGQYLAAFGAYGTCVGSAILFIITSIDQLQVIFGKNVLSSGTWGFIFILTCLPFAYIKTLEHVSFIAVFGALSAMLVLAVVLIEDFIVEFSGNLEGIDTSTVFLQTENFGDFAKGIVVIFFSYAAAAVFPEINRTMARPKRDFAGALHISFGTAATLYSFMAIVSYAVYGKHVLTSNTIISVLPPNNAIKGISFLFLVHLVSAFLVCLNPVFREVESYLESDAKPNSLLYRVVIRTCIVLACFIIAVSVPLFESVMAFIGATTVTAASFTCPSWFYLKLFRYPQANTRDSGTWTSRDNLPETEGDGRESIDDDISDMQFERAVDSNRRVLQQPEIYFNIFILIVTSLVAIVGAGQALYDIILHFKN